MNETWLRAVLARLDEKGTW